MVGAFIFSRFIVLTQFPTELTKWAQLAGLSPFWILMAVMALYIVLGTFLDEVSTILITVPITLPLIISIGYDGIWFGIFVTVMCTIGLITPADRHDRVRDPGAASGNSGDAHLSRHAAVPGGRFRAGRRC